MTTKKSFSGRRARVVVWSQKVARGYVQELEKSLTVVVAFTDLARDLGEFKQADGIAVRVIVSFLDYVLGDTEENGDGLNELRVLVRKIFISEVWQIVNESRFRDILGAREAIEKWLDTAKIE